MLTVEITEDVLLDNLDRTCTVLDKLRETGVRIAIDDFGSGYAALWYLRQCPSTKSRSTRGRSRDARDARVSRPRRASFGAGRVQLAGLSSRT